MKPFIISNVNARHDGAATAALNCQQYLDQNDCFAYFVTLLKQAQLWESINNLGPITLLAPTNTALRSLDDHWQEVFTHQAHVLDLRAFLSAQFIFGQHSTQTLVERAELTQDRKLLLDTLCGRPLQLDLIDQYLRIQTPGNMTIELGASNHSLSAMTVHVVDRFTPLSKAAA